MSDPAWVEWMSTLMGEAPRQTYAAALPPDRFYCLLDDLPLHLIPVGKRDSLKLRCEQELVFNPDCVLTHGEQLPDDIAVPKEVTSAFALEGTVAWVRDAVTGARLPFWIGPKLERTVENLRAGQPFYTTVRADEKAVLLAAGIVVPAHRTTTRNGNEERSATASKSAAMFQARGYAPLSDLIHPFHIAALRRYYRHRIRTGAVRLGDGQSPRRYVAYNDPVARFFHHQLTHRLSALAGEPLKPSYVYLASYLAGADLQKHTDRAQCEFSVTLCLDFSPEPALETPWPIELETPTGTVKVYQALGDGLAYRGTRLPHSRGVLPEGQTSTSIFFHYVPQDFAGSLD